MIALTLPGLDEHVLTVTTTRGTVTGHCSCRHWSIAARTEVEARDDHQIHATHSRYR